MGLNENEKSKVVSVLKEKYGVIATDTWINEIQVQIEKDYGKWKESFNKNEEESITKVAIDYMKKRKNDMEKKNNKNKYWAWGATGTTVLFMGTTWYFWSKCKLKANIK